MGNKFELTEEEQKKVEEVAAAFPAFEEAKKVTDQTPIVYITNAFSKQLSKEGKGATFMGYAVNCLIDEPEKVKEVLERAGYTVEGLPKVQ